MGPVRVIDAVLLAVLMLHTSSTMAIEIDLPSLLQHKAHHKRTPIDEGNPCPDPEKPFPCKESRTCIPMAYVCDDNYDCEGGYDEDESLCTAAHRPPVEDIMHFLDSEKDWLMPNIFGGKSVGRVAHALALSPTVGDFKHMSGIKSVDNLQQALDYVTQGDEEGMQMLGMPPSAWNECAFFFGKLIKSGFGS